MGVARQKDVAWSHEGMFCASYDAVQVEQGGKKDALPCGDRERDSGGHLADRESGFFPGVFYQKLQGWWCPSLNYYV